MKAIHPPPRVLLSARATLPASLLRDPDWERKLKSFFREDVTALACAISEDLIVDGTKGGSEPVGIMNARVKK